MIAIIAGTGDLPVEASKALLERNDPFFVIALFPENNLVALKNILQDKAEVIAQEVYKVGQILKLLESKKTSQLLMIGKVDKSNLFHHLKLDWLAIKILASLVGKNDAAIMERIVSEFTSRGIDVLRQDDVLGNLLVPPGVLTGSVDAALEQDIDYGIKTAIALSRIDVGQTVVIKDKMIMAVEAIEGTDACIRRGIDLGKNDIVVCKAAQKFHNTKFDLPTLGPSSLANLQPGEIKAIAWLSSHTLIVKKEAFIARARELGITLISVASSN
jgi:hypothetical protein